MERTRWTDERIDGLRAEMHAGFDRLQASIDRMQASIDQMKLFMLGGLVTILAAVIALHG
ncbi:MAG TPA: hypothetical protein VF545_13995 [Thermoleophilaceae bacterium]|jgi:hypothetical protein